MTTVPVHVESEIRNHLTESLINPEQSEIETSYYLKKQDINMQFTIRHQEYHRKGQSEHGFEIIIRLENASHLVSTDIRAISKDLENILCSKLSYNDNFNLEEEGDEYVFMDEIIYTEL